MRLKIYVNQGPKISLLFPTGLLLNRFTAGFLPKILEEQVPGLQKSQCRQFIKTLLDFRRRHKDWVLADITTAEGEKILIKL